MLQHSDFAIPDLGEPRYGSPLRGGFVSQTTRIVYDVEFEAEQPETLLDLSLEKAGPRARLFFEPSKTTAAIVTCGGLSPGLNNVIKSAYLSFTENHLVSRVLGIRNGYLGLNPAAGLPPIELTPDFVEDIDKLGGTVLGTSRGPQDTAVMVDSLCENGVNILLCIGGDGTQRGAHILYEEITRRKLPIAVVGVPKTIDNDVEFVWQSFGYATALERAAEVIRGAHVEARSARNGIGLVKLMGRDAGFIAAGATLASQEPDYTLVPEVAFPLDGPNGLLASLENRMRRRQHAVIVVAEGAGQHLFDEQHGRRDASGNKQHHDIGPFLAERIKSYFAEREFPVSLKYLDPSYYIRSTPANSRDRILSDMMARHAVHAGMAGKTNVLIGYIHNQFVHVPISTAVQKAKRLDVQGDTWSAVIRVTGQPAW